MPHTFKCQIQTSEMRAFFVGSNLFSLLLFLVFDIFSWIFSFNTWRNKYCAQFHQAVIGEGKMPTCLALVSSDLLSIWEFWDLHLPHMGLFVLCRKMSLAWQKHLSISQESSKRKHRQQRKWKDLKEDFWTSSKKYLQQAWSLGYLDWPSAVWTVLMKFEKGLRMGRGSWANRMALQS